ncbi:hypothetical protein ASPZODRAFT_19180 [Penicilliopsis zonata CBS 506.65]|uniref:Xylanolytic transcriptional activator regulatory domain-containing protein n=1 Tax=Penicilliopsis zonata CBS 506.65 TaxID=1073090 RepID=A0A1L9S9S1_9EURO|nr:hypothetical protein ASPZODRAFT_19180 [Penicilliopsis zonata CBS 506.65]OJJ43879.1 hypothetical protein ASPZODRAFT_19180 [Penicilliopsis zonata CBS 506.65]
MATGNYSHHDLAIDPLIQLYYQNFHPSHPFLLPRKALLSLLNTHVPPYLLAIIRYVGAHHQHDSGLHPILPEAADTALHACSLATGFTVQGMLLLAITEHAHGYETRAHETLQRAIALALQLGMDRPEFALKNSFGSATMAESWRRTYWELYVVEGLLAAVSKNNRTCSNLYTRGVGLNFPCNETIYSAGTTAEAYEISSFAHRIEAIRSLDRVFEISRANQYNYDEVQAIDTHLTSSLLRLPVPREDLDEMVVQAQMVIYLAMIHLYQPLSSIRLVSNTQNGRSEPSLPHKDTTLFSESKAETTRPEMYAVKLNRAADMLAQLATLPSPIRRRTPFLIDALATSTTVHTAVAVVVAGSHKEEQVKARIQLEIGALNALGEVWPVARMVNKHLLEMYQEMRRKRN